MQESTRARCIHHKASADVDLISPAFTVQSYFVIPLDRFTQLDLIEILDADILRLANKVRIDIRPIPVRIRNPIVRTGRNQQLVLPAGTSRRALAELVMINSKPALKPAVQVRKGLLPCPIFREWGDNRQIIPKRKI